LSWRYKGRRERPQGKECCNAEWNISKKSREESQKDQEKLSNAAGKNAEILN